VYSNETYVGEMVKITCNYVNIMEKITHKHVKSQTLSNVNNLLRQTT